MISHFHRTVFVHIPKCAGQSVETAFLDELGLSWETRAPLLLRENGQPALGPPRLAHLLARDYVRLHYLSQDLFDGYFKFAVVRDPWSRAASFYRYLDLNMSFADFVTLWLPEQLAGGERHWFLRPQADYLFPEGGPAAGPMLVDALVRFERIGEDFAAIMDRAALHTPLPHVNRSHGTEAARPRSALEKLRGLASMPADARMRRIRARLEKQRRDPPGPWRQLYTPALAAEVARLYADDVAALGYSFDG